MAKRPTICSCLALIACLFLGCGEDAPGDGAVSQPADDQLQANQAATNDGNSKSPTDKTGDKTDNGTEKNTGSSDSSLPPLPGGDSTPPATTASIEDLGGRVDEENGQVVLIQLSDVPINDDDLASIRQFPSVKRLLLSNTFITDAGLVHLQAMTNLEELSLTFSDIGDAGMQHVGKLTTLKKLNLFQSAVGDAGIAELVNLSNLEDLKLQRTNITDEAVPHLSKLTSLKELWVGRTGITPAGVERLRTALPNTTVRD